MKAPSCEHKFENFFQGSYVCKCKDGFLLGAKQDKTTHEYQDCTNINECDSQTGLFQTNSNSSHLGKGSAYIIYQAAMLAWTVTVR